MIPTHATTVTEAPARLVSGLATLVLSLATGTPLRSVPHIVPHAGERDRPHPGI